MMKVFQVGLVLLVLGSFVDASNFNLKPYSNAPKNYSCFGERDKSALALSQSASKNANNARSTRDSPLTPSTSLKNGKPRQLGERQKSDVGKDTPFIRNTRLTSSMYTTRNNNSQAQNGSDAAKLERNQGLLRSKPRESSLSRNPSVESATSTVTLSKTSSRFSSTTSILSTSGRLSRQREFSGNHPNRLLGKGAPSASRSARSRSTPAHRISNSISSSNSNIEKPQSNPARKRDDSFYSVNREQLASAYELGQQKILPFVLLVGSALRIDGFSCDRKSVEASIQSQIQSEAVFDQLLLISVVITDIVVQLINERKIKKMTFDDCCFESSLMENLNVEELEEFHLINTKEDVSSVVNAIIPRLSPSLVHLNLSGNVFCKSSQTAISKFISLEGSKLVTLNLSSTRLNSNSSVLSSIFRSTSIKHLYLAKNYVGSKVLQALKKYELNWITLDISYNSMEYVDKMFDNIGTVESLDISYCFDGKDVSMLLMSKRNLQSVNYSGNNISHRFEKNISKSHAVFHLELSVAKNLALQTSRKLVDFRKLSSVYVALSESTITYDKSVVKSATFDAIESNGSFDTFKDFITDSENLNEIHIDQWLIDELDTSKSIKPFTTIRSLTINNFVSKSKSTNKHDEFLRFLFALFPNLNRLELGCEKFGDPFYFPPSNSLPQLPLISYFKLKNFVLADTARDNLFFYLENTRQLITLHLSNVICSSASDIAHILLVRTLQIDCTRYFLSTAVDYLLKSMPYIYFLTIKNPPNEFIRNKDIILKRLKNLRHHEVEPKKLYLSPSN